MATVNLLKPYCYNASATSITTATPAASTTPTGNCNRTNTTATSTSTAITTVPSNCLKRDAPPPLDQTMPALKLHKPTNCNPDTLSCSPLGSGWSALIHSWDTNMALPRFSSSGPRLTVQPFYFVDNGVPSTETRRYATGSTRTT